MLNKRSCKILEAAVQEYIKEGKPIGSKELSKKYKFGIKDATIRAELKTLTDLGYLEQPHTSSGRIPSDKGYQYIVNCAFEQMAVPSIQAGAHIRQMAHQLWDKQWTDFISGFSEEMNLLSAGFRETTSMVYKSGLDELFESLELESKNDFYEIARDFEQLNEKMEKLPQLLKNSHGPQIFIGKKSPITQSEHLSVIIENFDINGNKFYVAAIGSKRMNYKQNLRKMKQIKESAKK